MAGDRFSPLHVCSSGLLILSDVATNNHMYPVYNDIQVLNTTCVSRFFQIIVVGILTIVDGVLQGKGERQNIDLIVSVGE